MFKLRRRGATSANATDLPFCSMCGQQIRVDAATGRCVLGHRVAAPTAIESAVVADETTMIEEPTTELSPVEEHTLVTFDAPAYTSPPAGSATDADWALGVPADSAPEAEAFGEFLTWGEPDGALSALDVDTAELPTADETAQTAPTAAAPVRTEIAGSLLDELDDEAYARRKAFGTLGATLAVTATFVGAVAVLPF